MFAGGSGRRRLTAQQREAARESRKRIAALSTPKNAKDQAATGATTRTTFVLPEHLANKLQGKWDFIEKRANRNRFSETRAPDGPGPAAFDTRTSLSKGPAAPMGGRHAPIKTSGETVPGPGAYSPAVQSSDAVPAYSMGERRELQTGQMPDGDGPGPGAYHIASAAERLKDSAPQFGFGLKTAEKDLECSPGPAAYTPTPPRSRTPRGAAIGSARRGLEPVQKSDDGGVDIIEPDNKWTTPRAPTFTLGVKVKDFLPTNVKLGPGPASVNTAKKLGRKRGGGGVPFSTAERMKNRAPETADAKFSGQRTTLSNKGFATTKAKARPDLRDSATSAPGPGAYEPRAVRKASNAPFWGTAKALEETQALKDSASTNAGGPGPAMYDTHEAWAVGTGKGLGSGPRAPLSGRHLYGSYLPPEIAADAPTEQQVAEAPVGDGKREVLKRMMEAELAKMGV